MRTLLIAVLLLIPSLASAVDVPYSGQLTESGVLINGTRYIQLNVYASPFGGSPLYVQAESLAVVNGVYHTMLNAPTSVWDGTDRWVGVFVNGSAELSPRVKVGWVPYAVYTPKTPLTMATRFSNSAFVGDQWTKIDSVTVNASVDGFTIISVGGFALQTVNPESGMQYAIAETTPAEALSLVKSIQLAPPGASSMPMNATITTATPLGTHKYYLWGKVLGVGGQYQAYVRHFSALFIPN